MKQNFLTKVLLLFALIVGSASSAWAEDAKVTLDLSSNSEWGFPAGSGNKTVDINIKTLTVARFAYSMFLMLLIYILLHYD